MSELDPVYYILATQAVGVLVITVFYYLKRLKIEERKAKSSEDSFKSMVIYHAQRLDIEQEKLKLQKNGTFGQIANPGEIHVPK